MQKKSRRAEVAPLWLHVWLHDGDLRDAADLLLKQVICAPQSKNRILRYVTGFLPSFLFKMLRYHRIITCRVSHMDMYHGRAW